MQTADIAETPSWYKLISIFSNCRLANTATCNRSIDISIDVSPPLNWTIQKMKTTEIKLSKLNQKNSATRSEKATK